MVKYYAVRVGRNPGVYDSWEKCKQAVDGYTGAEYKSFKNYEDAVFYLDNDPKVKYSDTELVAYIDGSYDKKQHRYSYGAIVYLNHEKYYIYGSDNDSRFVDFRNVAGEIIAATKVIQFAVKNGVRSVELHYDYAGIEKWAKREWKRNNDLTNGYANYVASIAGEIDLSFVKVKAHSGHALNDEVDELAKNALTSGEKHIVRKIEEV